MHANYKHNFPLIGEIATYGFYLFCLSLFLNLYFKMFYLYIKYF